MTLLEAPPVPVPTPTPPPVERRAAVAGVGRWRVAARLARRELRRRPWRSILVALLVAAPVAGVALVDVAYRSGRLSDAASTFGRAAGLVDVYGVDGATVDEQLPVLVADRYPHVAWATAMVPLRNAARPDVLVAAQVSTLDATADLATGIVDVSRGRLPEAADEVLLGSDVARRLGVEIGDELTLVRPGQTFQVVGIGRQSESADTLLAPGFDVTELSPNVLSARVLVGRDGDTASPAFTDYLPQLDPSLLGDAATSGWGYSSRLSDEADDPIQLFFGWLGGTMLMGAMGIVVAAAFAISGRRQLVTVGQLSATGADGSVLRRYLALQGTWTGVAGALLGVGGAAVFCRVAPGVLHEGGRLDVRALDWSVIAATAVVVATVAALLPARSLARVSTLTALGGRRPVPPVSARQVRWGTMLLSAGLVMLTMSVVLAREANDVGATLTFPVLLAMLSGSSVLAGVCLLGPVWVAVLGRVARGRRGTSRLATRDLDRHRVRSGALIAAVMVVGAAAVAVGATVEQEHRDRVADQVVAPEAMEDTLWVDAYRTDGDGRPVDVDAAAPDLRARIETVIGPVTWIPDRSADTGHSAFPSEVLVANADLLALRGLPSDDIEQIVGADVALTTPIGATPRIDRTTLLRRLGLPPATSFAEVPTSSEWFGGDTVFVAPELASQVGAVSTRWYGRAMHPLSDAERQAVNDLGAGGLGQLEAEAFADLSGPRTLVNVGVNQPYRSHDWTGLARWATINVALLLVLLVVGIGLALESAEGRDDLDTLVALGASPAALARIAAWKAGLLAVVGGVLSVPLGFGGLWLCVQAADRETTFPWIVAIGVAVVVPVVVAAVAWLVRRLARPRHRALEAWS